MVKFELSKDEIKGNKKIIFIIIGIALVLIAIVVGTNVNRIMKDKLREIDLASLDAHSVLLDSGIRFNLNAIEYVADGNMEDNINETEVETEAESAPTGKATYYIKVNYQAQCVTIYAKDDAGNYTKPVKSMVCSTGIYTPKSGVYEIPARWEWGALQGNVYGHYVTKITGNILFHSVPYTQNRNPASLEYWEYDKLGTAASLGCVRLQICDSKWIYDNCSNGTKVEFYASADPGPLGKPSAKKISDSGDELKNWDPTDPNENNPWKNSQSQIDQENNTSEENNTQVEKPAENNTQIEKPTENNTPAENNTQADKVEDNNSTNNEQAENNTQTENTVIENATINTENTVENVVENTAENATENAAESAIPNAVEQEENAA